jgi:hypothetical protein
MKKLFLLLTCLGFSSYTKSKELTSEHSHKMEVKFTVEASPKTRADWQKIEDAFAPFVTKAQTEEGENLSALLDELKPALLSIPEICNENEMNGTVHLSIDTHTPEEFAVS